MLTPEQQAILKRSITEDEIGASKPSAGALKMRKLARNFDDTIGTIPQGIKEGLMTSKAGVTGKTEAPKFEVLPGAQGTGQQIGQMIGQPLAGMAAGGAAGSVLGPVGAIIGAGIGGFATTPGTLGERAVAGTLDASMPLAGKVLASTGKAAIKGLPALFKKTNPRATLEIAEKRHDMLKGTSSNLYDYTINEANKRKIPPIQINEKIFDQIEHWLPATKKNKLLIERAKQGDVQSVHKLQSDLGKKAQENLHAKYSADRNLGELQDEFKNELLNTIHSHLTEQGHIDLSHTYGQAKDLWRQLKDIYYTDTKLAKVFGEKKKIPPDIVKYFSEESAAMKKFLAAHPEMEELLNTERLKKEMMKQLGNLGKLGTGIGTTGGIKYLINEANK